MTVTATVGTEVGAADAAVRLTGVTKSFGKDGVPVLDGIDLSVTPGEFVCLLGASGCGKSTLLNLVAGLDQPTSGTVAAGTARPAVMFQEAALLPWLTAGRNVELPLRLAGVGRQRRKERAQELLGLVRLEGQADKRPHELSGGMRQRVALARALAAATGTAGSGATEVQPGVLLMDEPFGALDAITRDFLQAELLRVWEATGTTILFVTHDVRESVRLAERVVLLSSRPGRVVREWGTGEDTDAEELHDHITSELREVISAHGR
jgi:NitT/TauT family transport system ATP-binding protein